MSRLSRGRLIDMLYHLSEISIAVQKVGLRRRIRPESLYRTEADIEFEPGYNSTPQLLYYNSRSKVLEIMGGIKREAYHLHPFLSLAKLTWLIFESDEVPIHLLNVIDNCKTLGSGCQINIHKCIKFDGEVQGIPVTHIYCSNTEDYNGSRRGKRFDWVELNTEDSAADVQVYPTTFGQVCAIVEIKISGQESGNFLLVTARASCVTKRGTQLMNPFITLKYDSNSFNLDELDVINKPAYVIPASTLRSQALETDPNIRSRILFVSIPYAFYNRDDWEDLSRGLTWSETEVSQGERQRLIAYRCTREDRAHAMIECIRHLEMLQPVPKKNILKEYRQNFSVGLNIEDIMTIHNSSSSDEEEEDTDEEHDFNFQCDEGLDHSDVALMSRIE